MGVNQSVEAEKRKIESIQIINKDIDKLRALINFPPSNETQGTEYSDTFKRSYS